MPTATSSDPLRMLSDDPAGLSAEVHRLRMARFEELADTVDQLIFPVRWAAAAGVRRQPVEFTSVRLGGVTISNLTTAGEVCATTVERGSYHVVMATSGHVHSECRGARVRVSPHLAAVYPPSGPARTRWTDPQDHPWSVNIDAALLESRLAAHLGHPVRHPVGLADSMPLTDGAARTWAALIRLIHDDAQAGWPLIGNPLIGARLHDAVLIGLLTAADHPYRQELLEPAPVLRPRPIKKAIDVIEAYPDRPLPITAVARMVGVSTRTLQEGFRQHVGMTPTTYARRVRLARAHRDLRAADPHRETVAAIAHRWGFAHLGRFAAAYRTTYGITPSQTLRSDPSPRASPL